MAIRRNSFVNLTGSLVGLVLFAALTPLYFHVIGSERYGILAIIWAFLSFFAAFDFGMGSALTFKVASEVRGDVQRQAEYFWTAMSISLPVGLVMGSILFGLVGGGLGSLFHLSEAVQAELIHSAPALLGIGACTILLSTAGGLLRGREYFVTNAVLTALALALSILLPVLAAVFIAPALDILILAMLTSRIIVVGSAILFGQFVVLEGRRPKVSASAARSLVGYGAWSSLNGVIELTISSADRFIMGAVAGPAAVGYYSVPSSVIARVMIFPTSIGGAALPQLAARPPEEETILARKIIRMVAMMTPCFVAGIFLAEPFLRLWMGASFAKVATLPMQILLPAFWLEGISAILFYRLLAQGRPRTSAMVVAIILLPYCALIYYLAGIWGVAGGAAGYLGRNMMFVGGRGTATRAWRMLAETVGVDFVLLIVALAACVLALPAQPPLAVGVIITGASIALTLKRRPPEFDRMVHDFARRIGIERPIPAAGGGTDV
ncbi:oligosaccharide flippase family protein [Sphingomonas sp. QA11]|uniref:oligosaccharide flippase family protein n=1 Tax=Sphingomonas sp. QA11 TaxID=2950605 RepID=UPI00234B4800|nr:oligosaccharide flippase family protein [Sphingomonas sp. QA11]WCM29692.1 oligosaccharide flippase family protein [Sphingomonas sp. QA11]